MAQTTPKEENVQALQERYIACIATVREDAEDGRARATAWAEEARSAPTLHCLALAHFNLGNYDEAYDIFIAVAKQSEEANGLLSSLEPDGLDLALLLGGFWAQAGEAAVLAGRFEDANRALTEALARVPATESEIVLELYIDRARTRGGQGDNDGAIEDLNTANLIDPQRLDVLLYRATAQRRLKRFEAALKDVNQVLKGQPDWADAYLERGNIRALTGDETGARSDWLSAERFDEPGGPAATAARQNLTALDEPIDPLN